MANIKRIDNEYNILLALVGGNKRFSQLLKENKKASLAIELNELQRLRYIERIVDQKAKPPITFYRITTAGRKFVRDNAEKQITKMELHLQRLKQLVPDRITDVKKNL